MSLYALSADGRSESWKESGSSPKGRGFVALLKKLRQNPFIMNGF